MQSVVYQLREGMSNYEQKKATNARAVRVLTFLHHRLPVSMFYSSTSITTVGSSTTSSVAEYHKYLNTQ